MTFDIDEPALWLCLCFEHLPLEVFARHASPENEKAVVILEKGRVLLMNEAASALGVRPGNSMDTVAALSESITSFERHETRELSTLSHLAQWAYRFTPNVSIKSPDSLLLEVTGCLKLFKGLANLKASIEKEITDLGYSAVIGINTTPLAALYTAHAGAPDNTGEVIPSLEPLRVDHLRVEKKIIESLHQTGIRTIGDLLKLPESGLSRRFGTFFVDHLQKLTGRKADPQKFISPEPRFVSEITFLSDVTDVNSLIFPAKRLLEEFRDFLSARQLYVNRFTWTLSHRAHPPKSFSIYLANPDNDRSMFQALTQLHLDKLDDVEEVDSLRLSASVFLPAKTTSGDLFSGTRFHQKNGRLHDTATEQRHTELLNMLRARLGPQTCFGLSLANDHRPEKAWKPVRLDQTNGRSPDMASENPRPFYLLNTPRMLKSIDGSPRLGGKLELLKGPERIDFGWWDHSSSLASRTRDYYIARHHSGALYWVFHYHNSGKWYLHGIFS